MHARSKQARGGRCPRPQATVFCQRQGACGLILSRTIFSRRACLVKQCGQRRVDLDESSRSVAAASRALPVAKRPGQAAGQRRAGQRCLTHLIRLHSGCTYGRLEASPRLASSVRSSSRRWTAFRLFLLGLSGPAIGGKGL